MKKNIHQHPVRALTLLLAALLCLSAAACKRNGENDRPVSTSGTTAPSQTGGASNEKDGGTGNVTDGGTNGSTLPIEIADLSVEYTTADLKDSYDSPDVTIVCSGSDATVEGKGAVLEKGVLTITEGGCYLLSGNLNGQILINAPDSQKVQLVLDNFTVSYGEGSPILCESADKLIITLAKDSVNTVNDTGSGYVEEEEGGEDANTRTGGAIHAKCALTVNGSGALTVNADYHNGIFSKKTVKIVSGTIEIKSAADALKGKNAVAVRAGQITLNAGEDGIQCSETDDATKGYIWIEGGDLNITAKSDGIDASLCLVVKGGTVKVTTTGTERKTADDSTQAGDSLTQGGFGGGFGGGRPGDFGGNGGSSADGYAVNGDGYYKIQSKGLKSGGALSVSGGSVTVNSTGHALKADGDLCISGSDTVVNVTARCDAYKANSKGLTADGKLTVTGGSVIVHYAYEGLEAANGIEISGGTVRVLEAADDGLNVGTQGQTLKISGGYLFVNASGDGLDSNGNIEISGGQVIVAGPTSNGDGALDCGDGNYAITVSGGLLIAYGSSGMAEAPSEQSSQCSISYYADLTAGSVFYMTDENGNVITAVKLLKNAQNIVVSAPELKQGATYTLYSEGSADTASEDGLCSGSVSGGSSLGSIALTAVVTSNRGGFGGGMSGGFGGDRPGGGFGGRPRL